jgi:competence protein ComEA
MKSWIEGWMRTAVIAAALAMGAGSLAGGVASAQEQEEAAAPSAEGVLNLNTATVEQLQALPGIGPSKAEASVAMRDRRGPFQRVEQVLLVRGIGRATFRRLRPMLTVEGPTTLGSQR